MSPLTIDRLPRRTVALSDGSGDLATGEIAVRIASHAGRSVAERLFHQGGLGLMRPLRLDESGQVTYSVVNSGGGYLDNDRYEIGIEVGPAASLLLTSQSATKVYRTPTGPATQSTRVQLGPGAVFESLPDQIIVYKDGSYRQLCAVRMDPTATYIAGEVVTAGWSPDGSQFAYEFMQLRTQVSLCPAGAIAPPEQAETGQAEAGRAEAVADGQLALVDNLILRPGDGPMGEIGLMDGHSHLGTFTVVDRRVDSDLVDAAYQVCQRYSPQLRAGVSLAPGPSLVMKALGATTGELTALIFDLDALVRQSWLGQERVNLRKNGEF